MTTRRRQRRRFLVPLAFLAPTILYIGIFYGFPIVRNLTMSLQEYTASTFYTGEAPWVGLENYRNALSSPIFSKALINTLLFTVGSIIGQFSIGMALALYFKAKFPFSSTLRSLLLLPWLIPMIVSAAIWRWILDKDSGVLNNVLGAIGVTSSNPGWLTNTSLALLAVIIVNIWIGIPFNTVILYGGLQDIPDETYEAAAIDGASHFRLFSNITWPLLRPTINVVLVLGVVYTLKVLDIILGLTGGGPADATQTLATQTYQLSFVQFDFGQGAAFSNMLIAISLLFAIAYLRANRKAIDE